MPLRLRLAAVTTALMAIVLAALGVFLYNRFESSLLYTHEKGLRSRAQSLVAAIERGDDVRLEGEGQLIEADEAFAEIFDREGRLLDSTEGIRPVRLSGPPGDLYRDGRVELTRVKVQELDERGTPLFPALVLITGTSDRIVLVGASIEDEEEALAAITWNLALGGAGSLLAVAVVGWVVAGFALRPVERLRREAAAIGAGDHKRLDVPRTRDELQRLGGTLNDMIERMRSAVQRERRFVGDASHELRTPLSVLRTELEVALRHTRTVDELEATLRSAAEETERLQRLAEDLLTLARADHEQLPVRKQPTELSETIASVARRYVATAAEREISIVLDGDGLAANVDRERVTQALDNLMSNALRHTPDGGTITLAARRNGSTVVIAVEDSGTGFAEGFLPSAFEPFTRSDGARTRDDGGTGLGLAIVRAIAIAHGGTVEATNREGGGARVALKLPV